jgi:pimeloyl-ACP methyl ester carboxylesterase
VDRRGFLVAVLGAAAACGTGRGRDALAAGFRCPPCGCDMDGVVFDHPGPCPACGMSLEPREEAELGREPAAIPPGASRFSMPGGPGRRAQGITVHAYRPRGFTPDSELLLVVPGAGRDGAEYRNDWLEVSERTGTVVAALEYPEEGWDFAAYHLGGVAGRVEQRNARVERRARSTVIHLDDDDFTVTVDTDPRRWLFPDFDRAFELLRTATGARRERYLLFGHSAGGQILHRAALFRPELRTRRIVAANAGFYTLPDLARPFPLGLAGTGLGEDDLRRALEVDLTLLLGELDNDDDSGGTLLHTPAVDRQGVGRLDRGRTFHRAGRREAERLGTRFGWRLRTVPDVGHDHRRMAQAAAAMLFPEAAERRRGAAGGQAGSGRG